MSPEQYKARNNDFTKALQEKCSEEGIELRTVKTGTNTTLYVLNNEGYLLHNDGNNVRWEEVGYVN